MNILEKDMVYKRIKDKFNGPFERGTRCPMTKYYFENKTINNFPLNERTPEICTSLMDYGNCEFYDVPEKSRTREFFLHNFTNKEVFNYIENNINEFDRKFFKDLIETNKYCCHFNDNCFKIMPLEYIDEEMCSLALLNNTGWAEEMWLFTVYDRKPEAISEDIWKLAARFYSGSAKDGICKLLDMTPEKYKDREYYKELCSCDFNCGMALLSSKGKIMKLVPDEIIDEKFLIDLLKDDKYAAARFSKKGLETEINLGNKKQVLWKYLIDNDGHIIKYIDLNDERIEYFLNKYGKDTSEYEFSFKANYKRYKQEKEEPERLQKKEERIKKNLEINGLMTLFGALSGKDPSETIDETSKLDREKMTTIKYLPIFYRGLVPIELKKQYDREEYLELIYKKFGIEILEEYDNLFYSVKLPEDWTIENDNYWNKVKDENGAVVFTYFYDSKFYDRDAYVDHINIALIPIEKEKSIENDNLKKVKN